MCLPGRLGIFAPTAWAAWLSLGVLGALPLSAQSLTPKPQLEPVPEARRQQIESAYGKLPLSFEANQGQVDPQVTFISRGSGYTLFLTRTEARLSLRSSRNQGAALGMKLVGANRRPEVSGAEPLPGTTNYFIGSDSTQWRTSVPTFGRVNYRAVYPGIDLTYYGNQRQLEYDFMVAPGADPRTIALEFQGANGLSIDAQGDLVVNVAGQEVRQHKPVVYQEMDGARRTVEGRYVLRGRRRVGFAIARYDHGQPLIIDPALAYSTYLGGGGLDRGNSIAVDSAGNAYVTGYTDSTKPAESSWTKAGVAGCSPYAYVNRPD
jgi:beta-propeller repeat-containing protein